MGVEAAPTPLLKSEALTCTIVSLVLAGVVVVADAVVGVGGGRGGCSVTVVSAPPFINDCWWRMVSRWAMVSLKVSNNR